MGAYIPEPRTEEENDMLFNFIRNIGQHFTVWLGATDSANEGTWVWQSDGEVLSYYNWLQVTGEINTEDKDCLFMRSSDGFWRYRHPLSGIYTVCEKKFEGNVNFYSFSSYKNTT